MVRGLWRGFSYRTDDDTEKYRVLGKTRHKVGGESIIYFARRKSDSERAILKQLKKKKQAQEKVKGSFSMRFQIEKSCLETIANDTNGQGVPGVVTLFGTNQKKTISSFKIFTRRNINGNNCLIKRR